MQTVISLFKVDKDGSMLVVTADAGFFADKDGNFISEVGYIKNANLLQRIAQKLQPLLPQNIPLVISQRIALCYVS